MSVTLKVSERVEPYSEKNPPPNLDNALNRIADLKGAILMIHGQMGAANLIIEDHSIHWANPLKKEKLDWKARANKAKAFKERELSFLKNWVRRYRQKAELQFASTIIDPADPKSLLSASLRTFQRLHKAGVPFTSEEFQLFNSIQGFLELR